MDGLEVHVVDMSLDDQGNINQAGAIDYAKLKKMGKTHIIQLFGMSNGITHMVDQVVKESSTYGKYIDRLAIWGHGGPGSAALSRNTDASLNAHWAGIDVADLYRSSEMQMTLGRLWDVLSWGAVVELRGCAVGAGDRGKKLLLGLVKLWEVRVMAGEVQQYGP